MLDLGTLPGGSMSEAWCLNDSGLVVGWADTGVLDADGNSINHAFLYTGGGPIEDLNSLIDPNSGLDAWQRRRH